MYDNLMKAIEIEMEEMKKVINDSYVYLVGGEDKLYAHLTEGRSE